MSLVQESTNPSSHLLHSDSAPWPSPYSAHSSIVFDSSPAPMSPKPLPEYFAHIPTSTVSSQDMNNVPASTWYNPSILAPECPNETQFDSYSAFMPPLTTATHRSPRTRALSYSRKPSTSDSHAPSITAVNTPSPRFTHAAPTLRSSAVLEPTIESPDCAPHHSTSQVRAQPYLMDRPRSSSSSLYGVSLESPWSMNPLNMHSPPHAYHSTFPGMACSPRSEPLTSLPSNHLVSPQPRRIYTPIAPQPLEAPRSHVTKRLRDEDEVTTEDAKRRKRSDSTNSGQFELSEEDKLLLHLKDEESMPWKDIAARFQVEMGKQFQIPALQMRLKRLRERMRVWTEADVRALRMAHEYWVQNKFDIIAQKMLEYGAHEKWTSRQCARKWTEVEPSPTPFGQHFEPHVHAGFAPYTMSPVEPNSSYLPFLHAQ